LGAKCSELKVVAAYKDLALTSVFITSLFALTFIALQFTSATNIAIILFGAVLDN